MMMFVVGEVAVGCNSLFKKCFALQLPNGSLCECVADAAIRSWPCLECNCSMVPILLPPQPLLLLLLMLWLVRSFASNSIVLVEYVVSEMNRRRKNKSQQHEMNAAVYGCVSELRAFCVCVCVCQHDTQTNSLSDKPTQDSSSFCLHSHTHPRANTDKHRHTHTNMIDL